MAKAKTTKLSYFNAIACSQKVQIKTLTDNIACAKSEKRIFLHHSLETRLVGLRRTCPHRHPPSSRSYSSSKVASIEGSAISQNPRTVQAALDLQSGILHAEDKDYTTLYSHFLGAFDNMSRYQMWGQTEIF
ncbi:hypothetical protein BDZ97DRAFT_1757907 [Flammula alnicola]|nr:hypothetical protein BDZ97DRAFT_1757907 [Flammula alnicola]